MLAPDGKAPIRLLTRVLAFFDSLLIYPNTAKGKWWSEKHFLWTNGEKYAIFYFELLCSEGSFEKWAS